MKKRLWLAVWAVLVLIPQVASADLNVVREVTITPKPGRVLANVGSVNQACNIRMEMAVVGIAVGKLPEKVQDPVMIAVHASFTMDNDSGKTLALTVGFPVSNSRYSAYAFDSFLKTIPGNGSYYFFDYYLTSGASWKDTIGEEVIQLRLHDSWKGHALFSNAEQILSQRNKGSDGLLYVYTLRNAEPAENLYFALKRP